MLAAVHPQVAILNLVTLKMQNYMNQFLVESMSEWYSCVGVFTFGTLSRWVTLLAPLILTHKVQVTLVNGDIWLSLGTKNPMNSGLLGKSHFCDRPF